jgi:hypothetical protein
VDRYLGRTEDADPLPLGADPADAMVGGVETPGGDESVNHDHYLYGWPKDAVSDAARRSVRHGAASVAGEVIAGEVVVRITSVSVPTAAPRQEWVRSSETPTSRRWP